MQYRTEHRIPRPFFNFFQDGNGNESGSGKKEREGKIPDFSRYDMEKEKKEKEEEWEREKAYKYSMTFSNNTTSNIPVKLDP